MTQKLKKIVIVGGGAAGWMSAAFLARQLDKDCEIKLIESSEIGTVGVGEATIPPIKQFNNLLGIKESDFLKSTQGTFKLGIDFENWHKKGDRYFHPFGRFGLEIDYAPFHFFWLRNQADGVNKPVEEYSMAWHMAKNNKFAHPSRDARSVQSTFDYAYHFDANLYANYLKNYSLKLGVKHQEGKVDEVFTHPESGFITNVKLSNGDEVAGDFFIDCTGFNSLLLGKTMGVGYQNWQKWLPCDKAVAVPSQLPNQILPYTRSIAHQAGWQWQIPLQSRLGNGLVYSSQYMETNEATETLLQNIPTKAISEPKHLSFTTGRRNEFWHKNCLAVGLSAGFLEPLESTSLHLIQSAILRFTTYLPSTDCYSLLAEQYNRETASEYEQLRDFLILHYKATAREDSEFWHYCKNMQIPEALADKIALYKHAGHLTPEADNLFKHTNWLAVMAGQGLKPDQLPGMVTHKQNIDYTRTLNGLRKIMIESSQSAPRHNDFIAKYCKS
ncbi:tryptophan halogenase family protein [Algibacillus agarilyticus]|uniref:tryptophan halogenase family protein n=1 Tax=Algibacillus agarilyticus TaxID=2234133 RepID=UPI000DCFB5C6|nr:tryptophan halogenase family protein [Algibacillus agarilyticus]